MKRPKICDVIENKHNSSILMLLYLCGRKSKTEIYKHVSTNPRMSYKLQLLEDAGIITMTREKSQRERFMVDLTPLGETYARGLCALEDSVGGDIEALRRDGFGPVRYEEDFFDD